MEIPSFQDVIQFFWDPLERRLGGGLVAAVLTAGAVLATYLAPVVAVVALVAWRSRAGGTVALFGLAALLAALGVALLVGQGKGFGAALAVVGGAIALLAAAAVAWWAWSRL